MCGGRALRGRLSQAGEEVVPSSPPTCPACPVTLLCVPNQAWKQKWQKKRECFGGGQPRVQLRILAPSMGKLSHWGVPMLQPVRPHLDASLLTGVLCSLERQFWLRQRPY